MYGSERPLQLTGSQWQKKGVGGTDIIIKKKENKREKDAKGLKSGQAAALIKLKKRGFVICFQTVHLRT